MYNALTLPTINPNHAPQASQFLVTPMHEDPNTNCMPGSPFYTLYISVSENADILYTPNDFNFL